jgi:hypothetical protein
VTAAREAITSPPILDSTRLGKAFLLDTLPLSELLEDKDGIPLLSPLALFFDGAVRIFGNFGPSEELKADTGAADFVAPLTFVRFSGVSDVNVVCGAGVSVFPLILWTPATTEAAVAGVPPAEPAIFFRDATEIVEAIDPF